jgi:peptide/nickel transport system ATP-binding protein
MALLSIQNLCVEYRTAAGRLLVIPDFALDIDPGESVGLVGESGCGKSTLLMAIMGYLGRNGAIPHGRILFEGRDLVGLNEQELRGIRGSGIAIVYQEPASALNPSLTIGRQLMEVPLLHAGASTAEAREAVLRVLADVHLPDAPSVMRRYPHQISGGQKQRVVLAMALLANPALLLLDEPTTGLDVTVAATVLDLINELRRKYRTALVYVSHNLGVIAQVCDRVGVMYAGELVESAPAAALFASPRHPYTRGLIASLPRIGADKHSVPLIPIPGTVPSPAARRQGCSFASRCAEFRAELCGVDAIAPRSAGGNHMVRCNRFEALEPLVAPAGIVPYSEAAATEPVLEAHDLSRVFKLGRSRLVANDSLDITARRGRVLAVVGESGSGKTTFARIITGLDRATGGTIRFKGDDIGGTLVRRRDPAQVAAIQMVFQNPEGTLNPSHRVGRPLARALRRFGVARGRAAVDTRVRTLLEMVRLQPSVRHSLPRQLSGGQKQRIAIARAFAGNPQLLIADEPVSSLDVSVQAAVINLLLRIQADSGTTMVFISHDLVLVRYLADEVVVMYLGRVMESGPVQALFEPPYHPYTEALLSAVPLPDPSVGRARIRLEGEIPSPLDPPPGCRFAGRCPRKLGPICDSVPPMGQEAADGHLIFCHIPLEQLRRIPAVLAGERRSHLREGTQNR